MMITETRNRNQLPWTDENWQEIDRAVHDECQRTKVAAKYLPIYPALGVTTIPSDTVLPGDPQDRQGEPKLTIDETAITPLIELEVQFRLTIQQMMETGLSSALTLATRAANLLAQGQDIVIYQGQRAIRGDNAHPLFDEGKVGVVSGKATTGLLEAPEFGGGTSDIQIIQVPTTTDPGVSPPKWGENTFGAIAKAYSRLQSGRGLAQAHYGPYACVLNFQPYADTYAPLATTLIIPADRIKPLVTEMVHERMQDMQANGRDLSYMYPTHHYPRYYGTGTVRLFRGLFFSLGGNTMDLAIGKPPTVEYVRQEGNFYCFLFL